MEACETFDFPILSEEQSIFVGKRLIHWSTDLWMLKFAAENRPRCTARCQILGIRWKGKEQTPVKVSGYPFSYDKFWFRLLECGLCGVDGIGILVHARISFGVGVIDIIGWLRLDAM
jgi:hypothetical protein